MLLVPEGVYESVHQGRLRKSENAWPFLRFEHSGAQLGGAGGARPLLNFILRLISAKDMSLNRVATHFTLGLRQFNIAS